MTLLVSRVIDNDPLPLFDQFLVNAVFSVSIPAEAFVGALIPCSGSTNLYKDACGHVRGADGSSEEPEAEVFYEVMEIGKKSGTIAVSVEP